jgi:hypothetical protein
MRCAPQSRLVAPISFIKLIVSGDRFGLLMRVLDVCFQNTRKRPRWKPQERLRLDEEQRLFPRSDHPGKAYQQQSIRLPAQGSFDLSMQDDQVVAEPRVFRQPFGFASGQIGECSQSQGGRRRFDPPGNIVLERVKAETDALLD